MSPVDYSDPRGIDHRDRVWRALAAQRRTRESELQRRLSMPLEDLRFHLDAMRRAGQAADHNRTGWWVRLGEQCPSTLHGA